jgi:hypothetical protein
MSSLAAIGPGWSARAGAPEPSEPWLLQAVLATSMEARP